MKHSMCWRAVGSNVCVVIWAQHGKLQELLLSDFQTDSLKLHVEKGLRHCISTLRGGSTEHTKKNKGSPYNGAVF